MEESEHSHLHGAAVEGRGGWGTVREDAEPKNYRGPVPRLFMPGIDRTRFRPAVSLVRCVAGRRDCRVRLQYPWPRICRLHGRLQPLHGGDDHGRKKSAGYFDWTVCVGSTSNVLWHHRMGIRHATRIGVVVGRRGHDADAHHSCLPYFRRRTVFTRTFARLQRILPQSPLATRSFYLVTNDTEAHQCGLCCYLRNRKLPGRAA